MALERTRTAHELKLFASNSMRGPLEPLRPEFERASGCKLVVSFDPAQIMLRRIAAGESADVAILGKAAIDTLAEQGKLDGESRRTLARVGVGIAVRSGAPHPDIRSVDALKRALLEAKSIAYTTEGASGMYFAGLIERLGIADQIKAKAHTVPGGLTAELVASGQVELAVQQVPELLAVRGVDFVGPLPQQVQNVSVVTAGIFAATKQRKAAESLLDFLITPASSRVFRAKGLEPA
ncbi:MAG TPA: substrate-binding domain-containing protein [Burkholderiales bacterium]